MSYSKRQFLVAGPWYEMERCPCDLVRNGGILNRFGQKKNEAVGKVVDLKKPRKISRTRTIEGLQAQ